MHMRVWNEVPEIVERYKTSKNFRGLDLSNVKFCGNWHMYLNLSGFSFSCMDLSKTLFAQCDLRDSNFIDANIVGTVFDHCKLSYNTVERNIYELKIPLLLYDNQCRGKYSYNEDEFTIYDIVKYKYTYDKDLIGYKSVKGEQNELLIAELLIPKYTNRMVFENSKCRCSVAKVLGIYYCDGKTYTGKAKPIIAPGGYIYKVGEMVYPDSYDDFIFEECSNGIHFFLTKEEAIQFGKRMTEACLW